MPTRAARHVGPVLAAVCVGGLLTHVPADVALGLAPALLLAGALAVGVFPGATKLEQLVSRRAARRAPRAPTRVPTPATPVAWRPTSLLLALSLASRPPPARA